MSKQLTNRAFDMGYEEILSLYLQLQQRAQTSPDATEAKKIYRENRDPDFQ